MAREPSTSTRVRDFVDDPDLNLEVVVAGDLERPVSWVHVTELLDPSPYVHGGEFILSAGVWGARGGNADSFVEALDHTCAAALGWGLLGKDEQVPDPVVRACRSAGLTLLAVPTNTPFIAVGRWFFEHLQAQREARLRATIERNERLVRSISALPGGLRGILGVLRGSVPRNAWVLGVDGRVLATNTAGDPPEEFVSEVTSLAGRTHTETPVSLDSAAVFTIGASGDTPAYLLIDGSPAGLTLEHRTAIEQALPLLGFVMAHERELQEAERRLATELVDAVLSKRTQFSAGRLEAYGLDPHSLFVGVVAMVDKPQSVLGAAKRILDSLVDDAVVAVWRDTITAVVQITHQRPVVEELGSSLYAALGPESAIGIGAEGKGIEGLRRSLIQARQAANLARRRRTTDGYVVHDKVESHALLLALQDEQVLVSFCDSLLGPIEEYDAQRSTELLPTLEAFLTSGGRWEATAQKLHIHVNTLRHRLARCEELTGRDISSMDDRVDFYIALRARSTGDQTPVEP
jgi:DNA-binding PucR family transcriptional regulator